MAIRGRAQPIKPHYGYPPGVLVYPAPPLPTARVYLFAPSAGHRERYGVPLTRVFKRPVVGSATAYTFSGPSSGSVGVASSNFSVIPNGLGSTVTVAPATDGSGTFTPASVTFDGTLAAQTFTYTATSASGTPHTLSVTNDGALTDPASLDYAVAVNYGEANIDDVTTRYDISVSAAEKYGISISALLPDGSRPVAFDIGDVAVLAVEFLNAPGGTAADPTTVTLKIEMPDGSEKVLTYAAGDITKDSTGNYHYDHTITQAGTHTYKFLGTGAVVAAEEASFSVRRSVF